MSYSDYFRKLNFSDVASGVQKMKNNEVWKVTNPINQQSDGFQTDIEVAYSVFNFSRMIFKPII